MVQPAENISRCYPAIGWQLMAVMFGHGCGPCLLKTGWPSKVSSTSQVTMLHALVLLNPN
jgi:hypothetical protein